METPSTQCLPTGSVKKRSHAASQNLLTSQETPPESLSNSLETEYIHGRELNPISCTQHNSPRESEDLERATPWKTPLSTPLAFIIINQSAMFSLITVDHLN